MDTAANAIEAASDTLEQLAVSKRAAAQQCIERDQEHLVRINAAIDNIAEGTQGNRDVLKSLNVAAISTNNTSKTC